MPVGTAALAQTVTASNVTLLGFLSPGTSQANAVNADGSVVVGNSNGRAFRWTTAGMVDLGTLGGGGASAYGVSWDGSVVVGYSDKTGGAQDAFRWTAAGGMVDLGTLGGTYSGAYGVSSDGSVVVGYSYLAGDANQHAIRWTSAGGMVDLGTLNNRGDSQANGVSSDGSVVVGFSAVTAPYVFHAFRWTAAGGMTDLGTLGGTNAGAQAVNSDGTVVVGYSDVTGDASQHAVRWTSAGTTPVAQDLGTLAGSASNAMAVNADGSVVVGYSSWSGFGNHAFLWTSALGMADLNVLMVNAGVDMTGLTLRSATGISPNGEFIVGTANGTATGNHNEAYLVRYTGSIAGVTTVPSVQASIDRIGDARRSAMAQEHGFAAQLLGDQTAIAASDNSVSAFAAAGSATIGSSARLNLGPVSLIGGFSANSEKYGNATVSDAKLIAAKLQYVSMRNAAFGWFGEAGGFISPDAKYAFTRTYANGAGTAVGTGSASGTQGYVFARVGVLYAPSSVDEFSSSVEFGRQSLQLGGYAETLSASNPFEAALPPGDTTTSVTKLRTLWVHRFSAQIETSVSGAWARAYDLRDGWAAQVAGIGLLSPHRASHLDWFEFGSSLDYHVDKRVTAKVFVNGVTGRSVGTHAHVGAGLAVSF